MVSVRGPAGVGLAAARVETGAAVGGAGAEAVAGAGAVEEGKAVSGTGVTGGAVGVEAQAARRSKPQMDAHRHKVPARIHLGKELR